MNTNHNVVATISQYAAPPTDRTHLLAEHGRATDEFSRARIEQRLWEGATEEEKKTNRLKRDFIKLIANARPTDVEGRSVLLAAGVVANPLWERVHAGSLKVRAAARLLTDARWLVKDRGITLAHAVVQSLVLHDAAPIHKNIGKAHLKRPSLHSKAGERGRFTGQKVNKRLKKTPLAESSRFWTSMREQIGEFMRERIEESEADPIVLDRLVGEFMKDLRVLTDSWTSKIGRAANAQTATAITRRATVIGACRTLSIDPPKPGRAVDLTLANNRKRMLARAYHPDGSGTDATAVQYQDVLEAYATLEAYNEGMGK